MSITKLARIAVGVPVVLTVAASLAWQIARLPRGEREQLYAVVWDVFFVGDEMQRGGK